jgi:hypothetical protein
LSERSERFAVICVTSSLAFLLAFEAPTEKMIPPRKPSPATPVPTQARGFFLYHSGKLPVPVT